MKLSVLSFIATYILYQTSAFSITGGSRRSFFKKFGGGALIGGLIANKVAIEGPAPYIPEVSSLNGKVIVITGGNTGLGLESAKRLAKGGASIILTSRNAEKGARAVQMVKEYVGDIDYKGTIVSLPLDLCDLESVKSFPSLLKDVLGDKKVDVLLNNAGVMAVPDLQITKDGYEKTFQSNHLGHFALTGLLLPMLNTDKLYGSARVINVSSAAHQIVASKGLDLDNLNGEKGYGPWDSYGRSKLENILFTKELQRRADAAGVNLTTAALHPGAVRTDLARYIIGEEKFISMTSTSTEQKSFDPLALISLPIGVYFTKAVDRGATTQIWLASGNGNDIKGKYYQNMKEVTPAAAAQDMDKAQQLWRVSEKMTGVKYNI